MEKLANQLMRLCQYLFASIPVTEWAFKNEDDKDASKWPFIWGLLQFVDHFRCWVLSEIAISQYRHKAMEFFIRLANISFSMGNFLAASAITEALQKTSLNALLL